MSQFESSVIGRLTLSTGWAYLYLKPHGARFVRLPNNFKVAIRIKSDVLEVDFIGLKSNASLCCSRAFIDADVYKSFDDFSRKGQKLLLERLTEAILSDICTFISGKYEGVRYPEEPYYSINGCLDIDCYIALEMPELFGVIRCTNLEISTCWYYSYRKADLSAVASRVHA